MVCLALRNPNTMKESRAAMKPAEIAGAMPNAFSIEVFWMWMGAFPGASFPFVESPLRPRF